MIFRILCILCFCLAVFSGYRFITDVQRLDQMKQIGSVTRDLSIALLNAETGQRGYLITLNPDYLAPYNAGRSAINRELADLDSAVRDTAQSREEVEVRSLTDQKMAELAHTIELRNHSEQAAVEEVNSHLGKNLMDSIRTHLANIDLWASGRYQEYENDTTFYARMGYAAFLATFVFGALGLWRR